MRRTEGDSIATLSKNAVVHGCFYRWCSNKRNRFVFWKLYMYYRKCFEDVSPPLSFQYLSALKAPLWIPSGLQESVSFVFHFFERSISLLVSVLQKSRFLWNHVACIFMILVVKANSSRAEPFASSWSTVSRRIKRACARWWRLNRASHSTSTAQHRRWSGRCSDCMP